MPPALLRQYFGAQVTDKVFRKLVDETLPGAIRDQRIEAIATQRIDADARTTAPGPHGHPRGAP